MRAGVDALLGPLADNGGQTSTHALLAGSPAIDAGDDGACPAEDQRGEPRPSGAGCDVGAFELAVVVGELRTWGDNNCAGGANPADSLKLLRFDAGLSVAQAAGCPAVGSEVSIVTT